ncbi:MAG: acetyl-CoA carboxylase, biotin carboxyl carrier protein [Gammaproteobacteria bacterium]|nr:acetyl-CoA carboxylase, biotin carboxyl carrier protein [Gammaproteobacteria bacterium]|tara:strand:+ start:459 stop:920 length:462 start_codon:yes stop_codon:yes gene_type:complete
MDIRKVKKLMEMLEESSLGEMEIIEGEESIRLSKSSNIPTQNLVNQIPLPGSIETSKSQEVSKSMNEVEEVAENISGHEIKSPMVGTFYEAPSPGSKPFVSVGDVVKVGDTLCIIEAMKMLNQIESDKSGVIKAIIAENAQPVEFNQVLFIIE